MGKGIKSTESQKFCIDHLRTDASKEAEGVWIDAGGGLRLRIARLNNPKYNAYLNELLRPHRETLRGFGEIDPEVIQTVTIKAMAKCVLLGWENLTEYAKNLDGTLRLVDGEPFEVNVPYTVEKAEEYLRIADFSNVVSNYARSAAHFRDEAVANNKGN
jgi:hypothetical protein